MGNDHSISRRKFLGAAAGAAGAAALGSWAPRAFGGPGNGVGERLVPPGKLGVQHFSIRDAITRRSIASSRAAGLAPTMGYLGGPNFPDDPTDLGPLVPLPGRVHRGLRVPGVRGLPRLRVLPVQPERRRARAPAHASRRSAPTWTTPGSCRSARHTGGLGAMVNPTTRQAQIDIAHTLGHTMIGTAGDPVGGARANLLANWQTAADNFNLVGHGPGRRGPALLPARGAEQLQLLQRPGAPRASRGCTASTGSRRTPTRALVFFEPDILHSYAGRARFPDPVDGSLWGPRWTTGRRTPSGSSPGTSRTAAGSCRRPPAGANPFTQIARSAPRRSRTRSCRRGLDRPGLPRRSRPGRRRLQALFDEVGEKGSRWYIIETDSGPGQAADPGRSLRHAKYSLQNMLGLRGGVKAAGQEHGGRRGDLRERLGRGRRLTCACAPSSSPASRRPWASRRRRTGTAIRPGTTSRRISLYPSFAARGPRRRSSCSCSACCRPRSATATPSRWRSSAARTTSTEDPGMLPAARSATPSGSPPTSRSVRPVTAPAARGHAARHRGGGPRDGRRHVYGPVTRAQAPALLGPLGARRPAGRRRAGAELAIAAVRRVARAGGHALPADVPPAKLLAPGPSRAGGGGGSTPGWLPVAVFAAVFLLAWLALRAAHPRPPAPPTSRHHLGLEATHAQHRTHRAHHRPRHRPARPRARSGCRRPAARSARGCASSRTR